MSRILQAKDKDNHTPLYLASKTGSAAIVALLKKVEQKYCSKENNQIQNDDIIKIALNNAARSQITDLC